MSVGLRGEMHHRRCAEGRTTPTALRKEGSL